MDYFPCTKEILAWNTSYIYTCPTQGSSLYHQSLDAMDVCFDGSAKCSRSATDDYEIILISHRIDHPLLSQVAPLEHRTLSHPEKTPSTFSIYCCSTLSCFIFCSVSSPCFSDSVSDISLESLQK